MQLLDKISLGFGRRIPTILQTEATECGLACIAMVAHFYGYESDLLTLRRRFPVSQKGTNLNQLIKISNQLNMVTRPLKLDLEDLNQLKTPCILHWDFNHFVVLQEISGNKVTLLDPAFGKRILTLDEVSEHFTGVALELWPDTEFEKKEEKNQIQLKGLIGHVRGLWKSLGQILILALALEVFSLISPFFMQWVIDHVIVSADRDLLTILAIGFGMLMLLQQFIGLLRSWIMMYMSTHLSVQWQANVFNHMINVPVSYFERRSLGDIVSRFGSIGNIQTTLTSTFLAAILDGLMTVFTLILMFVYSPKLAWIAIFTMSLYALIRWIWYAPLKRATEANIIHAAKQSSHFMETVRGAKTIKLFQRQDVRRSTWLRDHVATVLQDDILFAGSIAENICFFDQNPDMQFVQECAAYAAIHDDITRMPMGYQTLVGDIGNMLSGGQKQRILLARAIYKKPKILFMDEATSSLDILKEQEVNAKLKLLNITKIIIAHRPETIASAERIITLQDGLIVQDVLTKDLKPA